MTPDDDQDAEVRLLKHGYDAALPDQTFVESLAVRLEQELLSARGNPAAPLRLPAASPPRRRRRRGLALAASILFAAAVALWASRHLPDGAAPATEPAVGHGPRTGPQNPDASSPTENEKRLAR